MAYMGVTGGMEMLPARLSCKSIETEMAPAPSQSMQCPLPNKSIVCRSPKSKVWGFNRMIQAPARRVLLFQILAVFATMICKDPLLVYGLAKADEKKSYLLFDLREVSNNEVVLRGSPYTARLWRPNSSLLLSKEYELEEILSVKLKLLRSKASAFRVFINLPDANEQTRVTNPEFIGMYFHEPRRVQSPDYEYQVTMFRIGISDIIKELGLMSQSSILVTFVPCGADKGLPIVLENVQIEQE